MKILFVGNSFAEDTFGHIAKIAETYSEFKIENGFSAVATIDDVIGNGGKLSIPLYVRDNTGVTVSKEEIESAANEWLDGTGTLHANFEKLNSLLNGGDN